MSRRIATVALLLLITGFVSACAGQAQSVTLAPVSVLPEAMQKAPAAVRTAYQFAVAHPDALENVPCYCGCGSIGHHSNLACYIKAGAQGAEIAFDEHALGCSICVDIATDVMQMTGQGKSPTEIRATILDVYSAFGPSNQ